MNTESADETNLQNLSREEMLSALFANLIFQTTNMALMFLGRVPHPETGEKTTDLEAARIFIDQLEMIEVKTKGNLSPEEQKLLQQSLSHTRLAFVDAVQNQGKPASEPQKNPAATPAEAPAAAPPPEQASTAANPPDDEARKKFSKRY